MSSFDPAKEMGLEGVPTPWWHRAAAALREQWLFAALLGLTWCVDIALAAVASGRPWVFLPGATAMVVLALRARWYPVSSGVLAATIMLGTTAAARLLGEHPVPGVIPNVLLSENAAGLMLVLYAFWKAPRTRAIPVTGLLVLACLAAVLVRQGRSDLVTPHAMLGGLLQLVLVVGTGLYLRGGQGSGTTRTPLQAMLRGQWPVIAAMCVLLFAQVMVTEPSRLLPDGLVLLLSCLVMAGLAVLAPLRPVETAVLGAVTVVVMTGLSLVLRVEGDPFLLGPVPPPVLAAGMLLTSFVTRHAAPRPAVRSVTALVGSGLVATYLMPRDSPLSWPSDFLNQAFMGGVLLLVSIGTGMYFRTRDEDRARGVAVAVANAQQAERMALARELHDVVAHHVTGIVVQAQAARAVAETNPHAALGAMDRINASGTEALTAMRRLVGSLRDVSSHDSDMTDQPTTDLEADLRVLVDGLGQPTAYSGRTPQVELTVELSCRVPHEVARSTLRLVQEALTNVHKHALDVTSVHVSVVSGEDGLHVRVADDGRLPAAQPAGGSGGYGLVGMRERVALLGGSFTSGADHGRGWLVRAQLPLGPDEIGGVPA